MNQLKKNITLLPQDSISHIQELLRSYHKVIMMKVHLKQNYLKPKISKQSWYLRPVSLLNHTSIRSNRLSRLFPNGTISRFIHESVRPITGVLSIVPKDLYDGIGLESASGSSESSPSSVVTPTDKSPMSSSESSWVDFVRVLFYTSISPEPRKAGCTSSGDKLPGISSEFLRVPDTSKVPLTGASEGGTPGGYEGRGWGPLETLRRRCRSIVTLGKAPDTRCSQQAGESNDLRRKVDYQRQNVKPTENASSKINREESIINMCPFWRTGSRVGHWRDLRKTEAPSYKTDLPPDKVKLLVWLSWISILVWYPRGPKFFNHAFWDA